MSAVEDRLLRVPPFRVGPHLVRPALLEVEVAGAARTLEPKVMGVLCHLARKAGAPVSRTELLAEGWPDTVVGDEVLTRCVSELRKALGDDARQPTVIGTVPRIGYRLLAPVTPEPHPSEPHPSEPAGAESATLAPPPAPPAAPTGTAPPAVPAPRRLWTASALAAVAVAGLLVAAGYALASHDDPPPAAPLDARPLTTAPGVEMEPALSPDGRQVVYAAHTDSTTGLFVRPADGSAEPLRIAMAGRILQSPRWHPDGSRIAYIDRRSSASDPDGDHCALQVVPALGGPERTVAPCPDGVTRAIDWTADGRALLVSGHEDGPGALRLVDARTGEVLPLPYDRPAGAVDAMPRAAPDGRRVLFRRTLGEEVAQVCVLDLESGAVTLLITDPAMMIGAAWLPDGGVAYGSIQAGETTFFRLASADGTAAPAPFPITNAGLAGRFDVRGGRLAFERWEVAIGLFAFDPDAPGHLEPFAPSTAFDAYPQISPDGRRVAFISERSGTPQVWTAMRDGSRARQATDLPGVAYRPPRWSPDGQRLVFGATEGDEADVYVIDREGAAPRRLARPGSNELHPAWSADGRWLYVSSDASGRPEVWRLAVSGDGGGAVTETGGLLARPSPDGRYLYLMRPNARGLWRRPGEAGEDVLFLPGLRALDKDHWVPTQRGLVWAESREGRTALWSTAAEAPLFVFPDEGEVYALDWDEATQAGVVAFMGEQEADLMLAELP